MEGPTVLSEAGTGFDFFRNLFSYFIKFCSWSCKWFLLSENDESVESIHVHTNCFSKELLCVFSVHWFRALIATLNVLLVGPSDCRPRVAVEQIEYSINSIRSRGPLEFRGFRCVDRYCAATGLFSVFVPDRYCASFFHRYLELYRLISWHRGSYVHTWSSEELESRSRVDREEWSQVEWSGSFNFTRVSMFSRSRMWNHSNKFPWKVLNSIFCCCSPASHWASFH